MTTGLISKHYIQFKKNIYMKQQIFLLILVVPTNHIVRLIYIDHYIDLFFISLLINKYQYA